MSSYPALFWLLFGIASPCLGISLSAGTSDSENANVTKLLECEVRKLAVEFAAHIQPQRFRQKPKDNKDELNPGPTSENLREVLTSALLFGKNCADDGSNTMTDSGTFRTQTE